MNGSASIPCPSCGSVGNMPCPAAHAAGTTNVDTKTRGVAVGVGADGLMPAFGAGTTSGTQQTDVAKICAPPMPITLASSALFTFAAFIMATLTGFCGLIAIAGLSAGSMGMCIAFLVFGTLSGYAWLTMRRGAEKARLQRTEQISANERSMATWKASLICLRCHHIWVPDGALPAEPATALATSSQGNPHSSGGHQELFLPPLHHQLTKAPEHTMTEQDPSRPTTTPTIASSEANRSSNKSRVAEVFISMIRWIGVAIFTIFGLAAFTASTLSGLCFVLIAVLFWPQFQPMVARVFGKRLPRSLVIVAVPILFVSGCLFASSAVSGQKAVAEQQAAIEMANKEEIRKKKEETDSKELEEFMGKRADILTGAQKAFDEGHYENVLATTGPYAKYKDPELERIRSEARVIVDRKAAEAAALVAKKKEEEHRKAAEAAALVAKKKEEDRLRAEIQTTTNKLTVVREQYEAFGEPEYSIQGKIKDRLTGGIQVWGKAYYFYGDKPAAQQAGVSHSDTSIIVQNPLDAMFIGGDHFNGRAWFVKRSTGKNAFGGDVRVLVFDANPSERLRLRNDYDALTKKLATQRRQFAGRVLTIGDAGQGIATTPALVAFCKEIVALKGTRHDLRSGPITIEEPYDEADRGLRFGANALGPFMTVLLDGDLISRYFSQPLPEGFTGSPIPLPAALPALIPGTEKDAMALIGSDQPRLQALAGVVPELVEIVVWDVGQAADGKPVHCVVLGVVNETTMKPLAATVIRGDYDRTGLPYTAMNADRDPLLPTPITTASDSMLPFAADIVSFEQAIPLLKQVGHTQGKDKKGWATYTWKKLSLNGSNNALTLRDRNHDKIPESGTLTLVIKAGDQASYVESAGLTLKTISVASGAEINSEAFVDWFQTIILQPKVAPRRFGTVTATTSCIQVGADSILMIGLNEK